MKTIEPTLRSASIAAGNRAGCPVAASQSLPWDKACRRLVAPTHAALKRMGLNKRHWLLAVDLIDATLARGSHWALFKNQAQVGELRGFAPGDLSEALNGYSNKAGEWVKGLLELRIVKFTAVAEGLLVEFNPDYSRWDWPEMHSEAQRTAWLAAVAAQSRELERQALAGEVEERFSLATVLSALNVENALKLAEQETDLVEARPADASAVVSRRGNTAGVARPSCAADAPTAATRSALRSGAPGSSEIPNTKIAEKGGQFGNSEPSRARVAMLGNKVVTKPCNSIASLSSDELKLKLEGAEEDFCRAARQIMGSDWDDGRAYHFKGEGAAWRLRWRFAPARSVCVRVFLDLISTGKSGGMAAFSCWLDFGGRALDAARPKKIKGIF